jgi:hypothetical protein
MTDDPTSGLDPVDHPRRRMADHKIQALADSALLKVLSYVLSVLVAIGTGVIGWGLDKANNRLEAMEKASIDARIDTTELKYRTLSNEKSVAASESVISGTRLELANMNTRLLTVELEQKQLRERVIGMQGVVRP